ncbi:MAG: Rap1a/Tai family immunity protein [Gammaproteobacteria bacterium]
MKCLVVCLTLSALLLAASPAVAQEPSAAEWFDDCRVYLAVLAGQEGSDLDITYCTGLTRGILAGLGTGAGIGAVSMASALTVMGNLPEDEVRRLIDSMNRMDLLGICMPEGLPLADVVATVAAHLEASPHARELPVTAAFFEALQTRYPCVTPDSPGDGEE